MKWSPFEAPHVVKAENPDVGEWNHFVHRTAAGMGNFQQPEQYKEDLKNKLDDDLTTPSISRILVSGGGNGSRPLCSTIILQGSEVRKEQKQGIHPSI